MNRDKLNEIKPELAQSFGVEFGNGLNVEIKNFMSGLGFQFRRAESNDTQVTYVFERRNGDGTSIELVVKKGENYKSPAQIQLELAETEAKKLK